MFLTYKQHKQALPAALLPRDANMWRVTELALRSPWFMVRLHGVVSRELLVGSDADLHSMVQSTADMIERLCIVVPDTQSTTWHVHTIDEIWKHDTATEFCHWQYQCDDGFTCLNPPLDKDDQIVTKSCVYKSTQSEEPPE